MNIETKLAPKAVWFTPQEARNYYGKYSRDGITIHWWGDGTGADNHDNIVNYFLRRTDGSVNYVVSDNKITKMVEPDNVAWTSQSGNATTISIEHQPTLGTEGYKKSGWLVWQLEQRYAKRLQLYPHNHWWNTACPGTIDLNLIRAEADNWAAGKYTPVVTPQTTPTSQLKITDIPNKTVRLNAGTKLWDLSFTSWGNAVEVKTFDTPTEVEVSAIAEHPLGGKYYLSEYSFNKGIGNGINIADCTDVQVLTPEQEDEIMYKERAEAAERIVADLQAKVNGLTNQVNDLSNQLDNAGKTKNELLTNIETNKAAVEVLKKQLADMDTLLDEARNKPPVVVVDPAMKADVSFIKQKIQTLIGMVANLFKRK